MAPPTGPRADARTTRSSTRGGSKNGGSGGANNGGSTGGGIRKRSNGVKVDRNGDVIMGNSTVSKADGRKPGQASRGGRGGGRGAASTVEQKIRRHLGVSGDASLATRISELPRKKFSNMANRKVFKITGLQQSKAATNPDRGEKGLLEFVERKSAHVGRAIKIVKVCIL